jgi:multiple sugar transport system permease protein
MKSFSGRDNSAYIYLAPVLIGFLVFTLGPILATLYLSLTHYEIGSTPVFVGAQNYRELFGSDLFWQVVRQSFWYVILYVPLSVVASLMLALLLERPVAGIAFFRTVYFLPVVTSMVAAAIIWTWLYNGELGLLRYLLAKVGIVSPRWLEDPRWALPAIAIMGVWKNAGYNMMIFLAGLANVPKDVHEAARLDGATSVRRFFRITLPLISPVLFFVTIVTTISAFQIFEQTYVMTRGGPANSTLTLSFYVWQTAFQFFNVGTASAIGYVLFAIVAAVTAAQFWARKRWVFEA